MADGRGRRRRAGRREGGGVGRLCCSPRPLGSRAPRSNEQELRQPLDPAREAAGGWGRRRRGDRSLGSRKQRLDHPVIPSPLAERRPDRVITAPTGPHLLDIDRRLSDGIRPCGRRRPPRWHGAARLRHPNGLGLGLGCLPGRQPLSIRLGLLPGSDVGPATHAGMVGWQQLRSALRTELRHPHDLTASLRRPFSQPQTIPSSVPARRALDSALTHSHGMRSWLSGSLWAASAAAASAASSSASSRPSPGRPRSPPLARCQPSRSRAASAARPPRPRRKMCQTLFPTSGNCV